MVKWTEDNIITYINNTNKYLFVNFIEYKGIYSVVKVKCLKNENHGEFIVKFSNVKNNEDRRRNSCCKKCKKELLSNRNKLDYDLIRERIEIDGHVLISKQYENKNKKLEIKCPSCGNIFSMTYSNFHHNKQRCPKCIRKKQFDNQKLTYDFVKNEIEKDGSYILLSTEYNSCWEKLEIKCLKHDYIFYKDWHSFQQGKKCPKCGMKSRIEKQKHDIEYVEEYISSNGNELLSTKYINNAEKLKIKCNKGHVFYMAFSTYISGHRCPICNISKGEKRITEILDKYDVEYITQKSFDDCKFKNKLPFDFYLPSYNILIEYDGKQHYEIVEHFGGLDGFILTKIRDTIKDIYCKDNDIKLIRIPYWDFDNIENIINKELNLI